ncbi:MAG: anti-sigma factor family protein [Planctomycetota bacterium]|jgi:hypothetical protein
MKCTNEAGRFSEDLGALLDGELAPERHAEIEEHLEACESCREELERQRKLSELVGALPREKAPGGLAVSIMSAVTSSGAPSGGSSGTSLGESSGMSSDAPVSSPEGEAASRPKVLRLRRWAGSLTAVAAVLLVGIVGLAVLRDEDSPRRSALVPDASAPAAATRGLEMEDAAPEGAPGEPSGGAGWYGKGAGDGTGEKAETDVADAMEAAKPARASGGAATAPAAAPAVRAPGGPPRADPGVRADVPLDAAATRPETPAAPRPPPPPRPSRAEAALKRKAVAPGAHAFDEGGAAGNDTREAGRERRRTTAPGPRRPEEERLPERDRPDEGLVGERLRFEDSTAGGKKIVSRAKSGPVAAAATPAAEAEDLADKADDAPGGGRDALELEAKLKALLAGGERVSKSEAGKPGGTAAARAPGKPRIRIQLSGDDPMVSHIRELAEQAGGRARMGHVINGIGGGMNSFYIRVPTDRALAIVERLRSGKAPEAKGRVAQAAGKGADAPLPGARARAGEEKEIAASRAGVPTGRRDDPTAGVPAKPSVQWITIEVVVMFGTWDRPAAARVRAAAAEVEAAAEPGAAGDAKAAKEAAPAEKTPAAGH